MLEKELALGATLYLGTLRVMFYIFLFSSCLEIPTLLGYMTAFPTSPSVDDFFSWIGSQASIAMSTTGQSWALSCSGNGFSAQVCEPGGWLGSADVNSAVNFECGRAKNATVPHYPLVSALGDVFRVGLQCPPSRRTTVCSCFRGFEGTNCEFEVKRTGYNVTTSGIGTSGNASSSFFGTAIPTTAFQSPGAVRGWCQPSAQAMRLLAAGVQTRADLASRDSSACSGAGVCALVPAQRGLSSYSFCQCDSGSWGPMCAERVTPTMLFGSSTMKLVGGEVVADNDIGDCGGRGAAPFTTVDIGVMQLLPLTCHDHGFIVRFPVSVDGRMLSFTNPFRPQTAGVCMCESGFFGEECVGGVAVRRETVALNVTKTYLLLVGIFIVYRFRKKRSKRFSENRVTPGDFSIAIDGLPRLKKGDAREVVEFFRRFGPVHSFAPAFRDSTLRFWQAKKNDALRRLEMMVELGAHAAFTRHAQRSVKEGKSGVDVKVEAVEIGNLERTIGSENLAHPAQMSSLWMNVCATPYLDLLMLGSRRNLHLFIAGCNFIIQKELTNPMTLTFSRAFLTFAFTKDASATIEAFVPRLTGLFDKRPPPSADILDLHFRRLHELSVKRAPEPNEVIWDSLGTGPRERILRRISSAIVVTLLIVLLFRILIFLPTRDPGVAGILASVAVVLINIVIGWFWQYTVYYLEQPSSAGEKTRSIFFATLLSQLSVILAANIGVAGAPFEARNGYILDFFSQSGSFMLRVAIIEAFLAPGLSLLAIDYRIFKFFYGSGGSIVMQKWVSEPPVFVLADRCAGFMRIVILCLTFSPGLPALTFATTLVISNQVLADAYSFTHIYRILPDGAELSRALEATLLVGVVIHAFTAWCTFRSGDSEEDAARYAFFVLCGLVLWIASGYVSWKVCRGRDCCAGAGLCCNGWLCCFSHTLMRPQQRVHEFFVKIFFGKDFFEGDTRASIAAEKTAGRSYAAVSSETPAFEISSHPYSVWERTQLHVWGNKLECPEPHEPITAEMSARLRDDHSNRIETWVSMSKVPRSKQMTGANDDGAAGTGGGDFTTENPLVQHSQEG